LNQHGTRVIQKLIECLGNESMFKLFINVINDHVLAYMTSPNGTHIIIKFISIFEYPKTHFLYECIMENLVDLAMEKSGCVVIQKCLSALPRMHNLKRYLLNGLTSNALSLITDCYGNYVLQNIIEQKDIQLNYQMAQMLVNDVVSLSTQKVASNVIEKLLEHSNDETRVLIISKMAFSEGVNILLFDKFGNYVLQKALQVANMTIQNVMIKLIIPFMDRLKKFPSGSKLFEKLCLLYPEISNQPNRKFSKNTPKMNNNNPFHYNKDQSYNYYEK